MHIGLGGPLDTQTWQTEWKIVPLTKVQKPNSVSFYCGQAFVGQLWWFSGSPEFFTISYCAWLLNWVIHILTEFDCTIWQYLFYKVTQYPPDYIPLLSCNMGQVWAPPRLRLVPFCPNHHCSAPLQASAPCVWQSLPLMLLWGAVKCGPASSSSLHMTTS